MSPRPRPALDALGFRTRSGDVGSLVAWASLFDSDEVRGEPGGGWPSSWPRLARTRS